MRACIESVERMARSTVVVLATTLLELSVLPALYDALRECEETDRVDVVIYCRGGELNAARRVALLLHSFASHIRLIVPHYCESAGTALALAAHEIVAGPVAGFTPFDPILEGGQSGAGGQPNAICAEDIHLFARMAKDWFGVPEGEAQAQAMSVICANFFPTTLTAFYRATLETKEMCNALLRLSMPDRSDEARAAIVDKLLFGYHSHTYSLTSDDLKSLGLPIRRDEAVESAAWEIAGELRQSMRRPDRNSADDVMTCALIATRRRTWLQRTHPAYPGKTWEVQDTR